MSLELTYSKPKELTAKSYMMGMTPIEKIEFYFLDKKEKFCETVVDHKTILKIALEIFRGERKVIKYIKYEKCEFSLVDFLYVIEYILENTDLKKPIGDDPRVKFIEDARQIDAPININSNLISFYKKLVDSSIVNGHNHNQWRIVMGENTQEREMMNKGYGCSAAGDEDISIKDFNKIMEANRKARKIK